MIQIEKQKLAYTIDELTEISSIGRTVIYSQIGAGRLRAKKLGKRTLVLADDAKAWLASLEDV